MSPSFWRTSVFVVPIAVGCGSFGDASTPSEDGGAPPTGDAAPGDAAAVDCAPVVKHKDTTFRVDDYDEKVRSDAGGLVAHSDDDRSGNSTGGGSMRAVMPVSAEEDREAQFSKLLAVTPAKVRLKFSTKVTSNGDARAGCVLMLRASDSQADRLEVRSTVSAGQLRFDVVPFTSSKAGQAIEVNAVGPADLVTWYDVVYEMSAITATSAHVRISVNGVSKLDSDAPLTTPATSVRFKCGIDGVRAGAGAEAFVDDLELATCSP